MESSEVITITPNRILITPKVIFVTLGVLFLFDFSLNPVSVADDAKVKKTGISPSLPPVTPLKCQCTGRLRHGRENDYPSRYPPFFWFAPSHFENKGP